MNTQTKYFDESVIDLPKQGQLFISLFEKTEYGSITIITPENDVFTFKGEKVGASATLNILNWSFCEDVLLKGDIGLGEAFIEGKWESPQIEKLIEFGIENQSVLKKVIFGELHKVIIYRIRHLFNRNTKKGSKKNIQFHYDLGNDFYQGWLDKSLTYSSALFLENKEQSLFDAQQAKYQRILDELNLPLGSHILEIGCGWGGFMEFAAQRGYLVTGVTISQKQYEFTQIRLNKFKHTTKVSLSDYRDIKNQYDAIVSIEMFEALGETYWKTYFKKIYELLKPEGKAVIQSITINEQDFSQYRKGTDFIQQYIFPGGMLPSTARFNDVAFKQGLENINQLEFGKDYARTLNIWHNDYLSYYKNESTNTITKEFHKLWIFYLKYCEGGFLANKIGVSQFTLKKME